MRDTNIKVEFGAQFLVSGLRKAGYDAYVVGGCVRDSLLGDILVPLSRPQAKKLS